MNRIFALTLLLVFSCRYTLQQACGDAQQPISCYPNLTSLSYEREIVSTSTCGLDGPIQYSVRESTNAVDCCQTCDSRFEHLSHPSSYLTDLHVVTNTTTWISETGIYSPDTVNLTLSLPNRAELDTLSLIFASFKPHSFYLERSKDGGVTYDVMRYFSVDCVDRYQLDPGELVLTDDQVVCEEISSRPGFMLYIPDQTRPIGDEEDPTESDTLTEFVTFTHLRLVLDGHRIYSVPPPTSPERDMSYYYEIGDFSVSGRCACNGHSTECEATSLACVCEHNTQGSNCEECTPLYQDLPWRRGTLSYPFQCKLCECNSHSTSCYFDPTLYAESNDTSGGVCTDCMHNTTGVHCESCLDTFYLNPDSSLSSEDVCLECACNSIGLINNGVCNTTTGQCECKDNVVGRTCNACKAGCFNLSADNSLGCSSCNCNLFGSITANCDILTGQCECRENTQSQTCNQCKPGYYNIMSGTMDGCFECACDVGGSTSPICNSTTGDCLCREGVTGRQCDTRLEGYFVPLIDFVTLEGEEGNGTFSLLLLTTGVNEDFTGTGYASLMPSNTLTFQSSISVTRSGIYQLVVRYTLRSTASLSLNLRFDVNNNNLQTDGACAQQILTPTVTSISGFIPGSTNHTSVDVCLNSNIEYTLTLSHPGTQSTVFVDSLVVIPVSALTTLAVFNTNSSLLEDYTRECVEPRLQLDTWDDVNMRFCNPITLSLSAELYNGLQQCNCVTGGSTADNCTFDGQCSCVSGVGGDRTCSQCMPGYHGFTAGEGCSVCGCVASGSASGVCDFASGQCDCLSLVDGDKCDMCETGAYNFTSGMGCSSCECDILGSSNFQCLAGGECTCRSGVEGEKCETCRDGYFGLGINGCESCNCDLRGVVVGSSSCDVDTGECQCKANVEGRQCEECRDGYFNLDVDNPTGCRACYCNGRSDAVCSAATGYVEDKVTTLFNASTSNRLDGWVTLDSDGEVFNGYFPLVINDLPSIGLYETVEYFKSPAKFLNFKLSSYTQSIQIQLTISSTPQIGSTFTCPPYTLILRGSSLELATCTQLDITDSTGLVSLSVLLHESAGWVRTDTGGEVTEFEFLQVLSNLTTLLIRGSYFSGTNAYFHKVSLPTAVRSISDTPVNWVESCSCHSNYTGLSCSRCTPGYYRQPYGSCIRCNCFGDSSQLSCDPNTGECIVCPPSTTGGSCESCIGGYYGSPSEGIDCELCSCPGEGSDASFSLLCDLIPTEFLPADTARGLDIECTACIQGHAGMRCEFCEDNYYGDPVAAISCQPCGCSGNIVLNVDGNCDNITGICLQCINNTAGDNCERCATGYYGDAIQAKNCTECDCDQQGARNQECNTENGQCECRDNIGGRQCDVCLPGYFDISSGTGCRDCACNTTGTPSDECDVTTGQCECLSGVTGLKCDSCQQDYYGFSSTGCSPCNCFEPGSAMSQCDPEGSCSCKEGVFGIKCDKCAENFYNVTQGCIACPECYQELQANINEFRNETEVITVIIDGIDSNRTNVSFTTRLEEATNLTNSLVEEAEQLKEMELSNIELTHQLHYTADFLAKFITETIASIEEMDITISFVSNRAMSAVSLVDTTRLHLVEISDYLKSETRLYTNQTKELMDILDRMTEIAVEMHATANQHELDADEIEMLIKQATNLSAQASYTIMRTYQQLISVVTPSIQNLTVLLYSISPGCDVASESSIIELETAVGQLSLSSDLITQARTPNTNDGFNTSDIQTALRRFQEQIIETSMHSSKLRFAFASLVEKIKIPFDNLTLYSLRIDELSRDDNNLQEDASTAYNKSITARDSGNSLVERLNDTLVIVANFNETSTEVLNDTRESLKKVEQIQELSKQAEMNASQVLKEFSSAARVSNDTYTNSILAGDVATDASDKLVIFRQHLSDISEELSEYTISFNTTLRIVQGYTDTAVIQDNILNELRAEAAAEASFCISKVQEIGDLAEITTNEIISLLEELRIAMEELQPPVFDIAEFENSFNLLNETITNAQLENTITLLKERLIDQKRMRLDYASELSKLKEDLSELRTLESSLPTSCNTGV